MTFVGDGELAVAQRVPQLDGAIAGAGDDLSVVGGEGDGEDVVGVADEPAGRYARGELPQAEGLVPGGGECVGAVGGDDLVEVDRALAQELSNTFMGEGRAHTQSETMCEWPCKLRFG